MYRLRNILELIKKLPRIKKLFYSLLFILFCFLLSVAVSPLHKVHEFEDLVKSDSVFMRSYDSIWQYQEVSDMIRERTYKEALLKLAGKDSIQLAVNLVDSAVCLYLNGVKIHQTFVADLHQDKLLKNMPVMQQVKVFDQPLEIKSMVTTIVKEPIVVREAPRDTLEAALNAWRPDTLIQYPAFLLFRLEHGINLVFEQNNHPALYDRWIRFRFHNKIRMQCSLEAMGRFFSLQKQEYHPTITIKMPARELRAIYRALPQKPYLAIQIK